MANPLDAPRHMPQEPPAGNAPAAAPAPAMPAPPPEALPPPGRRADLERLLLQRHQVRDASAPQTRALLGAVPTSVNEAERSIEYVCSTEDVDSYGTILRANWDLTRFNKNPVVLFAHKCDRIPIGRAIDVRVENKQLLARVIFATDDKAEEVWQAVKNGFMPGISVGFDWRSYHWERVNGVEVLVFDQLELRELSPCPVPSNPNALARGASPLAASAPSADPNLATLERLRSQRSSGPSSPSPAPGPKRSLHDAIRAHMPPAQGAPAPSAPAPELRRLSAGSRLHEAIRHHMPQEPPLAPPPSAAEPLPTGRKRTLDEAIRAHMPPLREPEPVAIVRASMRKGPTP